MTLPLMFLLASQAFNLPPGLLPAVCYVESTHKVQAINLNDGGSASHGVCQLKLASARQMGFKGTAAQLQYPQVNAYFAAKYLRHQMVRYNGDLLKAIASYNSGTFKADKYGMPLNKRYVRKVLAAWKAGK